MIFSLSFLAGRCLRERPPDLSLVFVIRMLVHSLLEEFGKGSPEWCLCRACKVLLLDSVAGRNDTISGHPTTVFGVMSFK